MSKILELTIDDLGAQCDGIAHHNGQTVFVAGALPGERVKISLFEPSDQQQRADMLEVIAPSPDRISPPCPHFPRCGGCRMQHMEANAATRWKVGLLQEMLAQAGFQDIPLLPPVVTALATRRRARLAAKHEKGGVILGFNEWRSHSLINLTACPVLLPELVAFVQALRAKLPLWLPEGKNCDVQITALPGGMDVVMIGGPPLGLEQRQILAELAEELKIAQLSWRKWDRSPLEPVAHRQPLFVRYGETYVPFPPGSFLQATEAGESALIDFTRRVIGHSEKIVDLFCGLGSFGLSMPNAKKIHFADLDGEAIAALGRATKQNANMSIERRNLMADPYDPAALNAFDAVIFDPPRGGAKKQAAQLAQSCVNDIVAISCDPAAFVRDAKILAQGGYKLRALQPVDQFLWSTHLELAAHFTR